jgi:hypothetical protein
VAERAAAGQVICRLVLDEDTVSRALVADGLLDRAVADQRAKIEEALGQLIVRYLSVPR